MGCSNVHSRFTVGRSSLTCGPAWQSVMVTETVQAMSGGDDRYVDPEEKERAREMIEKLWNSYDANGDGALEPAECANIQAPC
jgi:hypothetical protein